MDGPLKPGQLDDDRMDRSRRVGWIDLDRLGRCRVLVLGAGALGNEVVKDLILSGIKDITVLDMDRVVLSNLNRCLFFDEADARRRSFKAKVVARKASRLDPSAKVEGVVARVQEVDGSFFEGRDLVLGCLDNAAARLHVNAHACYQARPLVDGGTLGTSGKVQVVLPREGPCLQCAMNRTHFRELERRYSCTGSDMIFFEPKLAAEITTTSIIAAIQVREGVKVLSGHKERCLRNVLHYNGLSNQVQELEVELDPDCPMHDGQARA